MLVKWAAFVFLLAKLVSPARILALFPFFGKSHFDVFEPYLRELASRGHEVLVVSHFPQKKPVPNIEDISLVGAVAMAPTNKIDLSKLSGISFMETTMQDVWQLMDSYNRSLAFHTVQDLIKSKSSFDVVISETFVTDFFIPFAKKFKAPLICVSSSVGFAWTDHRMANPRNPAVVPNVYTWFTDKMCFTQRMLNVLMEGIFQLSYTLLEKLWVQNCVNQYFEDKDILPEIAKNTSLVLMNTYFALHGPRPLLPNVVEVGGVHIKPPKKLPKDLEEYISSAEHGVIYFSMGSMIRAETFPHKKRDAFLQAFAELPQKVIWKWEGDTIPGQPRNVKISKWFPQFDVLSHPNVKAFVSQGGVLSTLEAVYAGVPMVGIPLYGDQTINIAAVVAKGMGVQLDYNSISKDTVLFALKAVLDQPSYKENANSLSRIYQDRPLSAMDTAIYWTEYIIRHKGAPHLRSAARDLNLFQYLLLDVIATIIIIVAVIIGILAITTKKILFIFRTRVSKPRKFNYK